MEAIDPAELRVELRRAEAAYQAAFRRTEERRVDRNALVQRAVAQGWTHERIATATGLTRARVGQIALAKASAEPNTR